MTKQEEIYKAVYIMLKEACRDCEQSEGMCFNLNEFVNDLTCEVFEYLHSQGVMIKVDNGRKDMPPYQHAALGHYEPLIEVKPE